MKQLKINLALVFALCIVTFSFNANAQMTDVLKLHEAFTASFNNSDANAISTFYTSDASIRNVDGSMVSGIDNIKAQYDAFFGSGKFDLVLKTKDASKLDKDYMFVSGDYVFTLVDGNQSVTKGEFVNTLKKVKGDWKIYKSYRYPAATNSVSVVDGMYKAFASEDIPAVLGAMDAKIVWNEAEGNALAVGNPYIGPDAVLQGIFAKISVDFDNFRLSDIKLHEMSNNQVLSTLRYNATSKHNGKTLNAQAAHLWTVKDGKITAFQQYVDTKQLDEMLKK